MLIFGYVGTTVAEMIQLLCSLGVSGFSLFSLSLPRPSAAKCFLEIQLNLPLLQTAYTVRIIKRHSCTKRSISYNCDQQIFKNKADYLSKLTNSFGNSNVPRKLQLFHPLQSIRHAQIKLPLNNLSCLIQVLCNFWGGNPLPFSSSCFYPA